MVEKEQTYFETAKSKHMFKSNNTVTVAGNGKTTITNRVYEYSGSAGWLQLLVCH